MTDKERLDNLTTLVHEYFSALDAFVYMFNSGGSLENWRALEDAKVLAATRLRSYFVFGV